MKPEIDDFEKRLAKKNFDPKSMFGLDMEAEIVKEVAQDYIDELQDLDFFEAIEAINNLTLSTKSSKDAGVGIRVLRHLMKEIGALD